MQNKELEKILLGEHGFERFLYLVWKEVIAGSPKPTPLQLDIAYAIQHGGKREIYEAFRGVGKGQPLTSKILSEKGWTTFADIKEGDSVYGSDGKLQSITKVHDINELPCYRFVTSDGREVECDETHLWKVRTSNGKWHTKEAKDIAESYFLTREKTYHNPTGIEYKFQLPIPKAIDYPERDLPLNPYVLGSLIGDGSLTQGVSLTVHKDDKDEILDLYRAFGCTIGKQTPHKESSDTYRVGILGLTSTIGSLGQRCTTYHKYIPEQYKTASIHQRVKLLQGLMDTDGSCQKLGHCEFSNTSEKLIDDVVDLVRSLGGWANKKARITTCNGKEFPSFRVHIHLQDYCPFLLRRKADRWKPARTGYVRLCSVEPIGVKKRRCISVSNNDHLYITDGYTLTHNSYICQAFVVYSLLLNPQLKILVLSAATNRADEFTGFVYDMIYALGDITAHLRPRKGQYSSRIGFNVGAATAAGTKSVSARGILSNATGARADLIIADDVESWNNSKTQLRREEIISAVGQFESFLSPEGSPRIIYLGTPQVEDSIYNFLSRDRAYNLTIWPARVPENVDVYDGNLAPYVQDICDELPVGAPIDPERFDELELFGKELGQGKSTFNLQFQLDTTLSDSNKYPLKLSDLSVMSLDRDLVPEKVVYGKQPSLVVEDIETNSMGKDFLYRPMSVSDSFLKPKYKVMSIDPSGRGCVDRDTEFMTPTGWKKICDYIPGDKVLQWSKDGSTKFVTPRSYLAKEELERGYKIKDSTGRSLMNRFISQEHRMPFFLQNHGKFSFHTKRASEVFDGSLKDNYCEAMRCPVSYSSPEREGVDLSEDELRLMVAFIADGTIVKGCRRYNGRFAFKKARKIERIKDILARLGVWYKESSSNGYTRICLQFPRLDKVFTDYYWGCSREQLLVIHDEFVHWDGTIVSKTGNKQFFSASKESADFIQHVIVTSTGKHTGFRAKDRGRGHSTEYIVSESCTKYKNILPSMVSREYMPGLMKYCFSVDSTYWVARREGFISIEGNSDETSYAVVSSQTGQFFVHRCSGLSGGYGDDVLDRLIDIAVEENVQEFIIESNFGDGMFTKDFERRLQGRIVRIPCSEVRSSIQKEKRIIDTLEPLMNSHRLIISTECLKEDLLDIQKYPSESRKLYSLQFQMTRITREKASLGHDDRLDALQMALAFLSDFARTDNTKAIDKINKAAKDQMIKDFLSRTLICRKPKSKTYKSWLDVR